MAEAKKPRKKPKKTKPKGWKSRQGKRSQIDEEHAAPALTARQRERYEKNKEELQKQSKLNKRLKAAIEKLRHENNELVA